MKTAVMLNRKPMWTALKVFAFLAAAAVLYLVVSHIGWRPIIEAVGSARRSSIWLAVALNFLVVVLLSLRVLVIMKPGERGHIFAMLPIYMAGMFGNVITPGARVGGEPIRAYYMAKAFGGTKTGHLGVLIADKLSDIVTFMVLVILSVAFMALFVRLPLATKIVLEAAVLIVILVVVSGLLLRRHMTKPGGLMSKLLSAIYNARPFKFMRQSFPSYQHFEDYAIGKLDSLLSPVDRTATSPGVISKVVAVSAVSWLVTFAAHWVLFLGLGAHVSFIKVALIVTIANFCGDLSVAPGGAGFMEAAMIGVSAAVGVNSTTAAAVTLISRGIYYFYGLAVGGLCFVVLACLYGRSRVSAQDAAAGT